MTVARRGSCADRSGIQYVVMDVLSGSASTANRRRLRSGRTRGHRSMVSAAFSIYDIGHPTGTPDRSSPSRDAAVSLEDQIRGDSLETGAFFARDGRLVIRKTGAPDRVTFTAGELVGTDGTLFTHNHPDDDTFSQQDIVSAIESQLLELRAVGPTLRHMMSAPGGWPSKTAFTRAFQNSVNPANSVTAQMISSGQLDSQYARREVCHQFWCEVARRLSLRYSREKS
jgi:hypothetical protein